MQAGGAGGGARADFEAGQALRTPPYRGSLPTAVPNDPLIHWFYELVSAYGRTFKELIRERFGRSLAMES